MAQTGFTPIQLYSTSTAAAAPAAGNLTNSTLGSELAINITDGKLFYKDNANAVQVIGWKTVPTTAGGTGLTTYTAGDLSYYASGTTFTKLAIGTAGQILTSTGSAPQWTTLSGVAVTTFSAGTTGFTPNSATSGAITLAGTLTVGNGGTGTATTFTAGSVVFAGASGIYSQDNANFFWDDANNRLGIGTATPSTTLDVVGILNTNSGATIRRSANTIAQNNGLILGTVDKATASTGGFGTFTISSNDASNFLQASFALFTSATAANRRLIIESIEQGVAYRNVSLAENGGNVGIGQSNPASKLDVNGTFNAAGNATFAGTVSITGGTFDALTIANNSTNSTGLRLQNSAASGRKYNVLSSGGGPAPAGWFAIYDDTGAATRFGISPTGGVSIGNTTDPGAGTLAVNNNLFVGVTSYLGSATNGTFLTGGIFSTVNNATSCATGTPTTIFSIPNNGAWIVSVYVFGGGTVSQYTATSLVHGNNTGSGRTTALATGANISISISTLAVQVTQTSGSTLTVNWSAIRIA
jgi:hypothetical protein